MPHRTQPHATPHSAPCHTALSPMPHRTQPHATPHSAPCHTALRRTCAMRTGSKSGWMTPLEGEAFFTSAIRPGRPVRERGEGAQARGHAVSPDRGCSGSKGGSALGGVYNVGTRFKHAPGAFNKSNTVAGRRSAEEGGRTVSTASRACSPVPGRPGSCGTASSPAVVHTRRSARPATCHPRPLQLIRCRVAMGYPTATAQPTAQSRGACRAATSRYVRHAVAEPPPLSSTSGSASFPVNMVAHVWHGLGCAL